MSSLLLHFIFLSFNLSQSLLPSSLLIPILSPTFVLLPLYFLSRNLAYSSLTINNPQSSLLFSFLSGLLSLFSTFLSSSHLIYLAILYFPRSIINIFSFYLNLPLFTLSPQICSRFCPFYSSILPLSLFISPENIPSLALYSRHFSLPLTIFLSRLPNFSSHSLFLFPLLLLSFLGNLDFLTYPF